MVLTIGLPPSITWAALQQTVDPLTRCVHLTYSVPSDAPEEVIVQCSWSEPGAAKWQPAAVRPLISETGLELAREEDWRDWTQGRVVERRAAGLERTVVVNPYPQMQRDGRVDVDFRIEIADGRGKSLSTAVLRIQADNTDVVCVEDWTKVLQFEGGEGKTLSREGVPATQSAGRDSRTSPKDSSTSEKDSRTGETSEVVCNGWTFRKDAGANGHVSFGNALYGQSPPDRPLAQLTYPLDLKGWYAIYVASDAETPEVGSIRLRLSSDEASDPVSSRRKGEEVLWKWARMDRQNLVLRQPHRHTGYGPAHIDYVRLVPLTQKQVDELEITFGKPDRLVAGYWEPYSWAFYEDVQTPTQHREPLSAFAWARIGLVDTQLGRMGMKVVYESRVTDPLVYKTIGDPIAGEAEPVTANVGRMQQYTNTLDNELRYARELELNLHANFGAGACYVGSPLQGEISKKHPDWRRGNTLRYEVPEVRQYAIGLFREALQIGATGISIDFCRYPEGVDAAETGNALLRELRAMVREYEKSSREGIPALQGAGKDSRTSEERDSCTSGERDSRAGGRIPILVRFPGTGVRLYERFDYRTWAREGLVDYLCPSNIQGRHMNIDMTPYVEAVKGTSCRLLPALDGLSWGLTLPGPFFQRVQTLYEAGVPGIYVYQADGRVLGRPEERRWMRMLSSSEAIRQWWERETANRSRYSKAVYVTQPEAPGGVYHRYERLRIWTDGVDQGPLEVHVDGKLVSRFDKPPYLLGTEDYESDKLLAPGKHELKVRARDGEGWLEQAFAITTGD
jgi:hypothetical protein